LGKNIRRENQVFAARPTTMTCNFRHRPCHKRKMLPVCRIFGTFLQVQSIYVFLHIVVVSFVPGLLVQKYVKNSSIFLNMEELFDVISSKVYIKMEIHLKRLNILSRLLYFTSYLEH
jgi:hypothetical protein